MGIDRSGVGGGESGDRQGGRVGIDRSGGGMSGDRQEWGVGGGESGDRHRGVRWEGVCG